MPAVISQDGSDDGEHIVERQSERLGREPMSQSSSYVQLISRRACRGLKTAARPVTGGNSPTLPCGVPTAPLYFSTFFWNGSNQIKASDSLSSYSNGLTSVDSWD